MNGECYDSTDWDDYAEDFREQYGVGPEDLGLGSDGYDYGDLGDFGNFGDLGDYDMQDFDMQDFASYARADAATA